MYQESYQINQYPAAAAVGGGRSAVFVYSEGDMPIIVLTNLSGGSPDVFIDEPAGLFIPDLKESNGFGLSASIKLLRAELEKAGYKNAIEEVKNLRKTKSGFGLPENEINSWGYKLIQQNRMADALEIFKLNVFLYPTCSNVYDSPGEIYAEPGDPEAAIRNYEQSLKLNPQNNNATQQLQQLKPGK